MYNMSMTNNNLVNNIINNIINLNVPYYMGLDNKSYIVLSRCPESLIQYSHENYNRLRDLIKTSDELSRVMVFNKNYDRPQLIEKTIHRWYKSYLKTPPYPVNQVNKSYMFSGIDKREIVDKQLPTLLQPYLDYFRRLDSRYNQVVANLYETDKHYIDYHRDWTYGMMENYSISILNINQPRSINRMFNIQEIATNRVTQINLTNGLIITMGGEFQTYFRHGIDGITWNNTNNSGRIGITFRQFY